jgi:2-amino-4-hydroxy-6-hydroxymethyldihydropteridine diphosphokinase
MNRRLAQGFDGSSAPAEAAFVTAVIALGSNLGDRGALLDEAAADLARLPLTSNVRVAPVMETVAVRPEGPDPDAPRYLNTVALLDTRLAPSVLLEFLHRIEADHGRRRRERWGDRTLDLDLIAYGDVRSATATLTLPHPRAAERDFVLRPWLALDADAVLPGIGRVSDLAEALS